MYISSIHPLLIFFPLLYYSIVKANLNKSVKVMTNTTTASNDAALVFVSIFSFSFLICQAMLWYTRYGIWVNFEILFLSQLQISLLQLKLQFIAVKDIRFLKLVERVSWSKKTQCGQQESPPDLQLSAQVLS